MGVEIDSIEFLGFSIGLGFSFGSPMGGNDHRLPRGRRRCAAQLLRFGNGSSESLRFGPHEQKNGQSEERSVDADQGVNER